MFGPSDRRVRRRGRVRVDEIEIGAILDPLPQHRVVALLQATPSDHGKARAVRDLDHLSRQEPKPLVAAVLLRLFEQELVPEAHTQQWLASASHVHDAPPETVLRKPFQGRSESPDSW